ncbi:hypothetical protein I3842_15G119800 [Carya illinoinensis]|uniref:Uncharacterized protein n=1 Tax=Carya illinoinensis TaxID=32201 RepID=A0A922A641_CARIL|nr:hypothetical protein I3842_15G119800 [Carya illinoinensis]
MVTRRWASKPSPCSSSSSSKYYKLRDKTTECICSACLLCFCCPLAVLWGCIKLPCKIAWHAVKHIPKHWACCGSNTMDFGGYSSFSDIDSDTQSRNTQTSCSYTLDDRSKDERLMTQTAKGTLE